MTYTYTRKEIERMVREAARTRQARVKDWRLIFHHGGAVTLQVVLHWPRKGRPDEFYNIAI
jgi:hypothetical protein